MKSISLWQPYASLIPHGSKRYETRSWRTHYKGDLLICSAKKKSLEQCQTYERIKRKHFPGTEQGSSSTKPRSLYSLWFGHAIAIVTITDCILMTEEFIAQQSELEIDCGDWQVGRWAWKLENIRKIKEPFPVLGKQGFFSVDAALPHGSCSSAEAAKTALPHGSCSSAEAAKTALPHGSCSSAEAAKTALPHDFETIEEFEEAWEKWNLLQDTYSQDLAVTQKAQLPQDTSQSGQLKAIATQQPSIESDSPTPDSLNKTLPPLTTNLSEISTVSISSLGGVPALISALQENAPGLKELADSCFLSSSDSLKSSSLQLFCGKTFQQSCLVEKGKTTSKSLMRLRRWGMWGLGKCETETGMNPKTESDYSVWVFTGDIRATLPKLTKKSLQEIFNGVNSVSGEPLHQDKRGASFAVLYRAASGDRIYHEQAPCLRSPNNAGNGAYKIREYQGKNYLERPINATEAEQLMGWEVGSTAIGINSEGDEITISQTQRIKMLGNGIIPAEITDILTAIKPMLSRKLEAEIPQGYDFAYRQLRQRGMGHQEAIAQLKIISPVD
jgi:hypothetical protein